MERGDTKKKLWQQLVDAEVGARTARFGRRVVVSMRRKKYGHKTPRRAGRRK